MDGMFQKVKYLYVEGVASCFLSFFLVLISHTFIILIIFIVCCIFKLIFIDKNVFKSNNIQL